MVGNIKNRATPPVILLINDSLSGGREKVSQARCFISKLKLRT